jgi:hypothetical protein
MRLLIAFLVLIGNVYLAEAKQVLSYPNPDSLKLPKVFILGEHERDFEKLQSQYATSLLSICNYDPVATYEKWAQFLIDMEDYSESISYDMRGVKMWIEVFWHPNGHIKHIAYALKPQSRNVDLKELSAFMSSFMSHYKPRFQPNRKISHSSHAFFPLTAQLTGNR